jgi:hypothetical protein
VSVRNGLAYLFLACFSQPAADRPIYRAIRRAKVRSILEIGIDSPRRTERMIRLAAAGGETVRYAAIDQFESRLEPDGDILSLKQAHRLLRRYPVRARLLPGEPATVLTRNANQLGTFDLALIWLPDACGDSARAWFYIPRLLHGTSRVFIGRRGEGADEVFYTPASLDAIKALARASRRGLAA